MTMKKKRRAHDIIYFLTTFKKSIPSHRPKTTISPARKTTDLGDARRLENGGHVSFRIALPVSSRKHAHFSRTLRRNKERRGRRKKQRVVGKNFGCQSATRQRKLEGKAYNKEKKKEKKGAR